jgi:hypothetical protein
MFDLPENLFDGGKVFSGTLMRLYLQKFTDHLKRV